MKPLQLEIPLPSIQIGDTRMRNIAKIFAEMITEETAELLDRLAGYAYYMEQSACGHWSYLDDTYVTDESRAFALAAKIRELLVGRE